MTVTKAKWTTDKTKIVVTSNADGSFHAEVPLLDDGVKQLTVKFDVTADREVHVLVDGEPGATLNGFQAWSDL